MLYMVSCEEKKVERRSFSRFMRKVKPVIDALTSYYNVVDTISQVDTSPAAVLWGCLKVLINVIMLLSIFRKRPRLIHLIRVQIELSRCSRR